MVIKIHFTCVCGGGRVDKRSEVSYMSGTYCFPGIKTEQLHRVTEKKDLGSPETVIIYVSTNDLRTTINVDFVMGELYVLVATAQRKLMNCRLYRVECCYVEMYHGGILGQLVIDSTG